MLTADAYAARLGAAADVRGADAVAKTFAGRARDAQLALVEGEVGLLWAPGGRPRVAFRMTIREQQIVAIGLIADPAFVGRIQLTVEDD